MYGSIEQVVKEIAKDEVKLKEFLSLTDIDEIYEYINEIDPSIEKEEFDEFLVSALGNYMEQNASLLSDYDLENVAGGTGTTNKMLASALSTLTLIASSPNFSGSSVSAASIKGTVSSSLQKAKNKTEDVVDYAAELAKKGYKKTAEWIKNNPKKSIAIATIAILSVVGGGIAIHNKKASGSFWHWSKPEEEQEAQADKSSNIHPSSPKPKQNDAQTGSVPPTPQLNIHPSSPEPKQNVGNQGLLAQIQQAAKKLKKVNKSVEQKTPPNGSLVGVNTLAAAAAAKSGKLKHVDMEQVKAEKEKAQKKADEENDFTEMLRKAMAERRGNTNWDEDPSQDDSEDWDD